MLTTHQSIKKEECLEILRTKNRLLLQGSAGTGKTYLVNELIRSLPNGRFYCSAPTNKAVAVLKGKINYHAGKKVTLITTHKALNIQRIINSNTGEVLFKSVPNTKNPPLKGVDYFIIDEASMISSQMLAEIEEHANLQRCVVIFLGDFKQLNPVEEQDSPVFNMNYPTVTLTEIVRQDVENPIIDLSLNPDKINNKQAYLTDEGRKGYLFSNDYNKVLNTLAAVNGTDKLKYLAYTNREVDKVNAAVRNLIYGASPAKIEVGETLVFDAPYGDYYTNEEFLVHKVTIKEMTYEYKYKGYDDSIQITPIKLKYYSVNEVSGDEPEFPDDDSWLNSTPVTVSTDIVKVIHEDSEKDFKLLVQNLKKQAKEKQISWKDYYDFYEQFAQFKYNHAITVHKSQGSTFQQAIVNIRDINLNKDEVEKKRLLYTALTRPSELLILYNA